MKETPVIAALENKTAGKTPAKESRRGFFKPVIQFKLSINQPGDVYEQEADAMADKVMRMKDTSATELPFFKPATLPIQRKCAHCEEEEQKLHRKENNGEEKTGTPAEEYIHSLSGGTALDNNERQFFESRMGYDFSQVRLHTNEVAAKSAQAVNALAYTTGNNIVFNSGQYNTSTESGKKLMAHELTHVVQQKGGVPATIQRACFDEERPSRDMAACPEGSTDVGRRTAGVANNRDARADAIIATAANTTMFLQDRAIKVVNDIICAYMPSQASKVRKILYYPAERGLHTQNVGTGATTKGDICVGDYFVNNTTNAGISRRVLQVAHELQHIDQYRSGMTGGTKSDEREFLAFYTEALADEFIGTGSMSHSTRKNVIDAALGYYYCLTAALQTQYATNLQTLLTRRQTVNGTNGNAPTAAPTSCTRQP